MTATSLRHNPASVWQPPEPLRNIYSHAVEISAGTRLLMLSGQIGVAPDGTIRSGFAAQCEQAMQNAEALLAAAGMTEADIVKLTYLLTRAEDIPGLGDMRRRRWASAEPPAVTVMIVAGLARPDYLVEIEVTAAAR
jgi:2-iminobutanoate/2-iminopropanoate deaminase